MAEPTRMVHFRPRNIREFKEPEKEASPSLAQWEAYQGLFDWLNSQLWVAEGKPALPKCILNFSRHKGSVGFFSNDVWIADGGKQTVHEISLNPDVIGTRTLKATVSTLAHEMVHCWQRVFGRPSRAG